jgi:8-oxo-dGTP pyrophosphatase MutT (NUDIX family)
MDGWYDMPAGHVEQGEPLLEAAIRELHEETGVKVVASDLDLWHINQFSANNEEYYNFFFKATKWEGEPKIMEPDKADDMQFFAIDALPKMTAGTHVAMKHFHDKPVSFDYIDQAVYDEVSAVA